MHKEFDKREQGEFLYVGFTDVDARSHFGIPTEFGLVGVTFQDLEINGEPTRVCTLLFWKEKDGSSPNQQNLW